MDMRNYTPSLVEFFYLAKCPYCNMICFRHLLAGEEICKNCKEPVTMKFLSKSDPRKPLRSALDMAVEPSKSRKLKSKD